MLQELLIVAKIKTRNFGGQSNDVKNEKLRQSFWTFGGTGKGQKRNQGVLVDI
jgi:hypothetical protein